MRVFLSFFFKLKTVSLETVIAQSIKYNLEKENCKFGIEFSIGHDEKTKKILSKDNNCFFI